MGSKGTGGAGQDLRGVSTERATQEKHTHHHFFAGCSIPALCSKISIAFD